MRVPIVAIVGRPNVGKSTLFNRIVGRSVAIVGDRPGVTRDRLLASCVWNGQAFQLMDTGGLLGDAQDPFAVHINHQVAAAIEAADGILFLLDGKEGLMPGDEEVAMQLRRSGKPLWVAVNKIDDLSHQALSLDAYRLGMPTLTTISALHGKGTGDLLDQIVQELPHQEEQEEGAAIRVAMVGRPNVGKSSLYNALLGEERMIVSEVAGTTRDAIDTPFSYQDEEYILIDTAGMRRKSRVDEQLEHVSVLRAIRALQRADVVCLVLDATRDVSTQDLRIANLAYQAGCSMIWVINKWDAVHQNMTRESWEKSLKRRISFWEHAPVLFVSAVTGFGIPKLLPCVRKRYQLQTQTFSTSMLNSLLHEAQQRTPPPSRGGRALRFYYATQVGKNPPEILLFVNEPERAHWSYMRYLENCLRAALPLDGVPLRLHLRKREGQREKPSS